jgi:hypothetical protein
MSKNLLWLTLVCTILGCAPATESRLPDTPSPLDPLDLAIAAGEYGNVDRLLVLRGGTPLLDKRYERDYREISRGHKGVLGCGYQTCPDDHDTTDPFNYYDPDTHPYYRGRDVHTLQSVTKSIAATLVGIAIERGELESVDALVLPFFAGYDLSAVDDRLQQATLDHLLTMRSGIRWDEGPLDETNSTVQLEHSDDWIQFTLSQPSDAAPGEKWVYSCGDSQLLSGVLRQATGQHVDAYAEAHLFGPLGILDYHWKKTPRGYGDTEGGLYLAAEDLARIGLLYLQDGVWRPRGGSTRSGRARATAISGGGSIAAVSTSGPVSASAVRR